MDLKEIGKVLQACALPASAKALKRYSPGVVKHCLRMGLISRQKGRYVTTQLGHEILLEIAFRSLG